MAGRTRREVWDRHAPRYDARTAWLERRLLWHGRTWVCARATGRTLEVGVGTGANLAHYGPDVELIATDPSTGMLEETRHKLTGLGRDLSLALPARLLPADVGDLPFEDGSFDSVVATYVLCCVPDVPLALTEIARVLRPGGQLLLADHVRSSVWPLRLGQRLLETVTVPLQEEHFTRRPRTLLEAAGLQVVESHRRTAGVLEMVRAVRPPAR
ncbi:class I SAM-dependent methyltransferase [Ornithinimicrobium pratense]|uniref:Class I SAM-dependent methyltransferase n=1 Tax=Ornithinimicrobium pratense TaxID=2593973 RepID=A0A5J6V930_9MICO|nr:class I SAM-dependent methyltransferase [Ornithinimicrobium pratense]QFG69977.1 class I SAM-dependent methyltransferase [Ornithinimicrobium pratense]